VTDEAFSGHSGQPNAQDSQSDALSLFQLDGRSSQLILQSMIRGFHSTKILACTPQGVILFANKLAAKIFAGESPDSVIGKNLVDMAPSDWALERIEYLKHSVDTKRPLMVIEILMGTRLCSTISPIELGDNGKSDRILLVTVEQITPNELHRLRQQCNSEQLIDARIHDLGPLSVLSPRELEVLALMGQGLRQKQIAERLHRSVSTVDRHRERIGEKLGIADRVELVGLAREAALEVEDSKRFNASFEYPKKQPS